METVIVGAIVLAVVCLAIRSMVNSHKKGGCSACGGKSPAPQPCGPTPPRGRQTIPNNQTCNSSTLPTSLRRSTR